MRKPITFKQSTDEVRYKSLLLRMEKQTFSSAQAIKIVGGKKRLWRFIGEGTIRAVKPEGATNRQWRINAADCLRCVKPSMAVAKMA